MVFGAILTLLLTVIIVSTQAFRAALLNPADTLSISKTRIDYKKLNFQYHSWTAGLQEFTFVKGVALERQSKTC